MNPPNNPKKINHSALPESLQEYWQRRSEGVEFPSMDAAIRDAMPRVWSLSDFVSRICLTKPDIWAELLNSGDLLRAYDDGEICRHVLTAIPNDCADETGLKKSLRQCRTREMLRIAWRDLAGWADLQEVMRDVSALADAAIDAALKVQFRLLAEKHGEPHYHSGAPMQMVVLGMGKLGGEELNFSSDIDLIFAYAHDGETDGRLPISYHEFFTLLGRKLIAALSPVTADGFVFRVDMRLRPNGDSGPLALSFDAMDQYYLVHGREWERYAMIKARPVAGDIEAGNELMQRLRPFIYRKYIDFTAIQNLRDMKAMIDRELRRKGAEHNVKLGLGGIREIEFIAQAFQLIRGGRDTRLQRPRLIPTLNLLADSGVLPAEMIDDMILAYNFLRRLEHRIQEIDDRQTQLLPKTDLDRLRVAVGMGHRDWPSLFDEFTLVTGRVHHYFQQLFHDTHESASARATESLATIWEMKLPESELEEILAEQGYERTQELLTLLRGLRGGSAYRAFSSEARDRMDRLMPLLLSACVESANPDAALKGVVDILEKIGRRSTYYALLLENPVALSQLAGLAATSPWIAQWISRHPVVLDELLNPAALYQELKRGSIRENLRQIMSRIPEDDIEARMNALREYHHGQLLRVAATDIGPGLGAMEVSHLLCHLAEATLDESLNTAWTDLTARHGSPNGMMAFEANECGFLILAYGKLGSYEMGYTSDLDLVFIYPSLEANAMTDGQRPQSSALFYQRLGQKLIHVVTTRTSSGRLYEIDVRLRPNGRSGPMASAINAWRQYQLEQAWTWEHMALVRARAVVGDARLAEEFEAIRREILILPRDPEKLRGDVLEMRQKMLDAQDAVKSGEFHVKHSQGGMVDIEFMAQYLTLRHAASHSELTMHSDTSQLLIRLGKLGMLDSVQADVLAKIYREYIEMTHHHKLLDIPMIVADAEVRERSKDVRAIWRQMFEADSPTSG